MRKILLASLVGLLTACGGGGNSSGSDDQRPSTQNRAPTVTLSGDSLALSNESIFISTSFIDPDNDQLSVKWTSSLDGAQFDQESMTRTVVKLPLVTEKQSITITCEVSDGVNSAVTKTHMISLYPEVVGANIELKDSYTFSGGDTVSLTASYATDTSIQNVSWEFDGLNPTYEVTTSNAGRTGDSTLTLTLPDVSEETEFTVVINVVTDKSVHTRPATVKITPADGPSLSLSLPEQVIVASGKTTSIIPTISHSDEIESYAWQWQPNPQPTNATDENKTYNFTAPVVLQDTTFDLSLEVSMKGGVTETAATKVLVTKQATQTPITLTSSHEVAASGQTVEVTSNLTDFSNIDSVTWSINNQFDEQYLTKENSKLTIQLPEVESFNNFHTISYTVKYKSGDSTTATQSLTYHNTAATRDSINIPDKDHRFELYPNREVTRNYTLESAVPIDQVRIVPITNLHTYDKLEVNQTDGITAVTVLDSQYTMSSLRAFNLIIKAGFAEKEVKIYAESYNSLLRTYAGVNETYVSGSTFFLYGQFIHLDGNTDYVPSWSSDIGVSKTSNDVALTAQYQQILPQDLDARLSLFTIDEADKHVTNSLKVLLANNLEVEGEHYRCIVEDRVLTRCTSTNSQLQFETQPEQLKQVVTRGYYACLLGNEGDVHCAGFNDSPVSEVPALAAVSKLNAVNYDTACAQFADASWQCWGNDAEPVQQLIAQSGVVHQILGNNTHTCLVSNGHLSCYAGSTLAFQSSGDFVENIVMDDGKLCYRSQGSNTLKCPFED
ncbi:hypothetical protein N480_05825 [Pseudoalteromonas luteoviolacea S2607]|uniref:hypothetical protein n=1 Tax=Pseudoalteromonas luteoviolacea TaxID=43657 RepID=UPI0007B05A57|nr:hypothetical protein [Pseudoalteromonas luteoviolacea]KZN30472.1 hypothetical protein N480_05825 [Pseudoalteromonas luteoviolacea S2607]